MRKVLGTLLILFGLSLALLSSDLFIEEGTLPSQKSTFSRLWKQDLVQLETQNKLPEPYFQIKEVKITPLNEGAKKLLENLDHPFSIDTKGTYKLEVMMDLWQDEEGFGVLMVYSIIDSSNNTVWEMNRTLTL